MTEYDYSPEAYERYNATQNRIANWVDKTEQHRAEFQLGDARDLPRSGPVSRPRSRPHPSPPRRQISGQPQPAHLAYPPPSESSDSSDSYYEGPWPQKSPPVLPRHQQPAFHLMQQPPMLRLPSPQRVSHHHRHRPRTHRRSVSHQSPLYYSLPPPPLPLGYQYTYPTVMSAGHQGYTTMPVYGATQPVMSNSSQQLPRSAPGNVATFSMPAGYSQPQFTSPPATAHLQPTSAFLAPGSQPSSQQGVPWSTYGATSPPYSMTSTAAGSPLQSSLYVTYQPFTVQQPAQQPCIIPPNVHQRVYDLSKPDSNKYYRRSVG